MNLKKIVSLLPPGFADSVSAAQSQELRAKIIEAEAAISQCDKERDADEKLKAAKELARELAYAYTETKNAQRAKIAYMISVLGQRGEL